VAKGKSSEDNKTSEIEADFNRNETESHQVKTMRLLESKSATRHFKSVEK
jgi:hypothetical protein